MAEYNKTSPYFATEERLSYLDTYVHRSIPASENDSLIVIEDKYTNRPDLLSQDLYGHTRFWWIFMVRNPDCIKDPIYGLVSGLVISVPSKARLELLIG